MTTNHDDLSSEYIEIVAEFATLIQSSLRKVSKNHINTNQVLNYMHNFKQQLPNVIENLALSVSCDATPDLISQAKQSEMEQVVSDLFTRVMNIFHKDDRSVNDLYNDMDINKDGKIKFEEMRTEFLKYDPSITIEESKAVFDILDGNKDGYVSLSELTKRMRFIKEKADLEQTDPLSCLIISKPLDPELMHGNLSIMLIKAEGLKPGVHSVRIKVNDFLEYLTPDTNESNPFWNFRADFFFENRLEKDLPLLVDVELMNKNKLEGIGSFQWKKAMNNPNEFSVKTKVVIKTSTGQDRGSLHFQIMWTPIFVRVLSDEDIERRRQLEMKIMERKQTEGDIFDMSDEEIAKLEKNEPFSMSKEFEMAELEIREIEEKAEEAKKAKDDKKRRSVKSPIKSGSSVKSPYTRDNSLAYSDKAPHTSHSISDDNYLKRSEESLRTDDGINIDIEVHGNKNDPTHTYHFTSTEDFLKSEEDVIKFIEKNNSKQEEPVGIRHVAKETNSKERKPSVGKHTVHQRSDSKGKPESPMIKGEIKKNTLTEPQVDLIHARNRSYSYMMKVATVTVEQVVKKKIKQPSISNQCFNVVIKNRRTIDPYITPLPKDILSKIPHMMKSQNN
ncbi:hypothetical protein SteCoe_6601 [Stentor coeruleus]|uniref:EF-hand domain-containing protein n=1 Tax=Stentor coeruleus TaxID=5963 RepID=A0A1R2CPL1_9CILI|nr:hypothetical protein SteCoe_6601 [Stentor coeruleus]